MIGVPLVQQLIAAGHTVAGMTRTPAKAVLLSGLGAVPVVCDAYDADALADAVASFAPDLVINELTDLPDDITRIGPEPNSGFERKGTRI